MSELVGLIVGVVILAGWIVLNWYFAKWLTRP